MEDRQFRRCGSDDALRILLEANWTRIPNCPDFTETRRVSLKRLRYANKSTSNWRNPDKNRDTHPPPKVDVPVLCRSADSK
jgi:hypothetical protein